MANKRGDMNQGQEPQQQVALIDRQAAIVRQMLGDNMRSITAALASQIPPEQFARICMTHFQRGSDAMAKADPRTFIAACVEAAQLGLKPDSILGECYLLPRWSKAAGCVQVNFQLGYRGLMKLVRRGGEVSEISAEVVYERDVFSVRLGTERGIIHKPWYTVGAKEPGPIIAAYAVARLPDGQQFKAIPELDLLKSAARSGDPRTSEMSNVWRDHPEAMRMKTAVLRLCKWLPMPDDAKRAIARDDRREAGLSDDDLREAVEAVIVSREPSVVVQMPPQSLDDLVPSGETAPQDEAG